MANEINIPRKVYKKLSFPEDFLDAIRDIKTDHDLRNPHNKISLAGIVKNLAWKQIDAMREKRAREGRPPI